MNQLRDHLFTTDYAYQLAQHIAHATQEFLPNEVSMKDTERYGQWRETVYVLCRDMLAAMQGTVDSVLRLEIERRMRTVEPPRLGAAWEPNEK